MSDFRDATLLIDAMLRAKTLLGDRGYDADWFSQALSYRGITPCIPSKADRRVKIAHDAGLH
jgi:hypothetical protein